MKPYFGYYQLTQKSLKISDEAEEKENNGTVEWKDFEVLLDSVLNEYGTDLLKAASDSVSKTSVLDLIKDVSPLSVPKYSVLDLIKNILADSNAVSKNSLLDSVKAVSPDLLSRKSLLDLLKAVLPDSVSNHSVLELVMAVKRDSLSKDEVERFVTYQVPDSVSKKLLLGMKLADEEKAQLSELLLTLTIKKAIVPVPIVS